MTEYPPPPVFARTTGRYHEDQIPELQEKRLRADLGSNERRWWLPCILAAVAVVCGGHIEAVHGASANAAITCGGKKATIVGTRNDDELQGTARADVIAGLNGDDRIAGGGGNDTICGGDGFGDTLRGNRGRDRIIGGPGIDVMWGGRGDDRLVSGDGFFNVLRGGAGDDDLLGGPDAIDIANFDSARSGVVVSLPAGTARGQGADHVKAMEWVVGSRFDDTLVGDGAANLLSGFAGDDTIAARGSGEFSRGLTYDIIAPGQGDDVVRGGGGFDHVGYTFEGGPVQVDLGADTATGAGSDKLHGVEGVDGSLDDDVLIGDGGDNVFQGFDGRDRIDGRGGGDLALYASSLGPLAIDLQQGTVSGGDVDEVAAIEDIWASNYSDVILGNDQRNEIFGLGGDDAISGADGDDLLDGGVDLDSLDGGAGSDICVNGENNTNCEARTSMTSVRATSVSGKRPA